MMLLGEIVSFSVKTPNKAVWWQGEICSSISAPTLIRWSLDRVVVVRVHQMPVKVRRRMILKNRKQVRGRWWALRGGRRRFWFWQLLLICDIRCNLVDLKR